MLPNNISLSVYQKGMWNCIYAHRSFKISVRITIYFVFPCLTIHKWFHLRHVTGIINGYSYYFNSGFFLPVRIILSNGRKLCYTWFAPGGPEADDDGFPVVLNLAGIKCTTFHILDSNC